MHSNLRVLIVSEHASTKFGGEAILPWHYFRILRQRGIESWLIVHERTRAELLHVLPEEANRIYFLPDTRLNIVTWRLGRFLPAQISYITFAYLRRLSNQWAARTVAQRLIKEHGINIIHQPIPVSPREPSLMYNMGVPVVIGPMNGNMTYPVAFLQRGKLKRLNKLIRISRFFSGFLNRIIPGKLNASILLVANERTKMALPQGLKGDVITLVENGVDFSMWTPKNDKSHRASPIKFIFLGRLVDLKAVDILLHAFSKVVTPELPRLEIIGDGPMRSHLEAVVRLYGLSDRVDFVGWQTQAECAQRLNNADVLVLPSLHECGGAVVLEAMACGLPVIATEWGGPADYLDETCGILVAPTSRESMVTGFAEAMTRIALDDSLRSQLGLAGRERVEKEFDWEVKIDKIIHIYHQAIAGWQVEKIDAVKKSEMSPS